MITNGGDRRDRDGEIFENDLTENEGATPAMREIASHETLLPTDLDNQTGDAFMHEHYGEGKDKKP